MLAIPDCHAHLDQFGDRLEELRAEWEAVGIGPVISVGSDLITSQKAVDLCRGQAGISAAVGLHPYRLGQMDTSNLELDAYREAAADSAVVALSEIGLDTINTDVPLEIQSDVLKWFIALAQDRGLPVILHLKAATEALLELWDGLDGRRPAGAMHGFVGTYEEADALLERELYLSLGPLSLGLVEDHAVSNDVVKLIPNNKLLLDSDAFPAFGPRPEVRPAIVADLATRVAEIRAVDPEDLKRDVQENFARLLNNEV